MCCNMQSAALPLLLVCSLLSTATAMLLFNGQVLDVNDRSLKIQGSIKLNACIKYAQQNNFYIGGFNYDYKTRACELIPKTEECKNLRTSLVPTTGAIHVMVTTCEGSEEDLLQPQELTKQQNSLHSNYFGRQNLNQGRQTCASGIYVYQISLGNGAPTGTISTQSLSACLTACETTNAGTPNLCKGVSLSTSTNICVIQTSITSVASTASSYVLLRRCFKGVVTFNVTPVPATTSSPVAGPSAAPGYDLESLVGDSGKCPDPYVLIANSSVTGGVIAPGITTAISCKVLCLNTATCVAADFNKDASQCFLLSVLTGTFTQGTLSCCDHYRKIACNGIKCYRQLMTGVTLIGTDLQNVVSGTATAQGVTLQPCAIDQCYTTYTFDFSTITALTQSIDRGCATTDATAGCTVTTASSITTTQCITKGERSNGYDVFSTNELIARFTMDCTADDSSGFRRNAQEFGGLVYDIIDAKRNWSAVFDGVDDYLQINTFSSLIIGGIPSNGLNVTGGGGGLQAQAGFAAALWIRRTSTTGNEALISNGNFGTAPIEIYSTAASSLQTITANFRTRDASTNVAYSVTVSLAGLSLNLWYFVVAELSALPSITTQSLQAKIFAGTSSLSELTATGTAVVVTDINTPLRLSLSPLCIGKQFSSGTPGLHFTGKMDDIWIFNRGNMMLAAYQAIMDTSKVLS